MPGGLDFGKLMSDPEILTLFQVKYRDVIDEGESILDDFMPLWIYCRILRFRRLLLISHRIPPT